MAPRPSNGGSLLWLGLLYGSSGYSDEARGFLRALEAAGVAPAARNISGSPDRVGLSRADELMLQRQLTRTVEAPCVSVFHWQPSYPEKGVDGAVNVTRTMFETDLMPPHWVEPLLERDMVWVPGQHNLEAFRRTGIPESKLRVLGGTMDFELFQPDAEPYALDVPEDHFTFLTNFAFQERKGWRQLLQAWGKAFGPDDGVCLVLKTGTMKKGDTWVVDRIDSFLRDEFGPGARSRLAPIKIVPDLISAPDMPGLYAAADAYVLPTRGEGWGRPFMEALAMGLPTVSSDWSCVQEFMRPETSWLIGGRLVPVPEDVELFPYFPGHKWFEPDPDALAEAITDIARDPEAARAKAAPARADLIERFGPERTAARIMELTEEALELHGGRIGRPVSCAVRGHYGSNASLAVVNDSLTDAWLDDGLNVLRRGMGARHLADEFPGVTHSWPPRFDAVTGGPTVMVLPWEFGAPPRSWVDQVLAKIDRVWVPSEYVREGYVAGGMPPGVVEVVPNGVDLERFSPEGPAHPLPREAGCTFLFVGGTIWRKGVDVLIEAWQSAFGPGDDVQLVVKDFGTGGHYKGQTNQDVLRALAARDDVAPVTYIDEQLAPNALPALYRAADVFVTPYRGEGFCLPALEAMACGLPVIHTGTGPTGEFVPAEGGWALPARSVPLGPESELPELAAPGYVQEVEPADLVEALRAAAAATTEERGARSAAALEAAGRHSWTAIAGTARRSLETLRAEGLPAARHVSPAEVEGRSNIVLYAPDWTREDVWAAALALWADAFGPDDDVTLALHIAEGDVQPLAGRIMDALDASGVPQDELPDFALCEPGSAGVHSLVASASAVLADAGEARPELLRRARRVVLAEPREVQALAAEMRHSDDLNFASVPPITGAPSS